MPSASHVLHRTSEFYLMPAVRISPKYDSSTHDSRVPQLKLESTPRCPFHAPVRSSGWSQDPRWLRSSVPPGSATSCPVP